jgi:hypothetical protein
MLDRTNKTGSGSKAERPRRPEHGPWDKKNLPIRSMVYWTNDYVVYINYDFDIDFRMDKAIPPNKVAEFNRILNEASSLEISVSDEFPIHTKLQCKELIGEVIACCLDEDFLNATTMLISARAFVEARSRELSRMWFVAACCLATLPLITIECLVWLFRTSVIAIIGEAAFVLVLCAGAGALGALLSVISRSGTRQFDASSGKVLHYFEGASRAVAGSISGIVAGVAVKSGLILTSLFQGDKAGFILILAAVTAGASERLATSIISDVSSLGFKGAKPDLPDTTGEPQKPLQSATAENKRSARRRSTSP